MAYRFLFILILSLIPSSLFSIFSNSSFIPPIPLSPPSLVKLQVHEKAQRNAEKISHNEETLEEHFTEIGYNKEGVSKNLGDIETMNSQIEDLDRTLKSAETRIKDNREGVSRNGDSVEDMRKTLTFVKTEVVEYCGYQSSWNKQVWHIAFKHEIKVHWNELFATNL